jgi:hypothetical protein
VAHNKELIEQQKDEIHELKLKLLTYQRDLAKANALASQRWAAVIKEKADLQLHHEKELQKVSESSYLRAFDDFLRHQQIQQQLEHTGECASHPVPQFRVPARQRSPSPQRSVGLPPPAARFLHPVEQREPEPDQQRERERSPRPQQSAVLYSRPPPVPRRFFPPGFGPPPPPGYYQQQRGHF